MAYEYLVASLPLIFFGDPPPFDAETFRRNCEGVLGPADLAALDRVLADADPPPEAGGFERAWHNRETQLRNEIAAVRTARRGAETRGNLRDHAGYDVGVKQAVADAYERPNPLEREEELDRARWRVLDELGAAEPFGAGAVLAFAVKLRIAGRWAALDEADGRARLEALLDAAPEAESQRESES